MSEYRKVLSASQDAELLKDASTIKVALYDIPRVVRRATEGYPTPKVTTRRGRGGGWYRWRERRVHYRSTDGFVSLRVILHECAHHVHFCSDPNMGNLSTTADRKRYWHGPEFTQILDRLTRNYLREFDRRS